MNEDDSLGNSYPAQDVSEVVAHQTALAAAGLLPVIGTTVRDVISTSFDLVATARTDRWMLRVAEVVQVLGHQMGVPIDEISGDGVFFDAVIQTGRLSQATGDPRKLAMLRDALAHCGSWVPEDALIQRRILGVIGALEPEHLIILKTFTRLDSIREAHPELGESTGFYEVLQLEGLEFDADNKADSQLYTQLCKEIYAWNLTEIAFDLSTLPFAYYLNGLKEATPFGLKVLNYLQPLETPRD